MKSGIYQIMNKKNFHMYVGSAVDMKERWYDHKEYLRKGIHDNSHLQNAWNKYNEDNFEFSEIEFVEKEELISKEQFYIDFLNPEYNICKIAGNTFGVFPSKETRQKMSESQRGLHSGERNGMFGKGYLISGEKHGMYGKTHTEEVRKRISEANSGENNFMFGKRAFNAKLKDNQIQEIKCLSKNGCSNRQIAKLFNVGYQVINNIITNKTYKDVVSL